MDEQNHEARNQKFKLEDDMEYYKKKVKYLLYTIPKFEEIEDQMKRREQYHDDRYAGLKIDKSS